MHCDEAAITLYDLIGLTARVLKTHTADEDLGEWWMGGRWKD